MLSDKKIEYTTGIALTLSFSCGRNFLLIMLITAVAIKKWERVALNYKKQSSFPVLSSFRSGCQCKAHLFDSLILKDSLIFVWPSN